VKIGFNIPPIYASYLAEKIGTFYLKTAVLFVKYGFSQRRLPAGMKIGFIIRSICASNPAEKNTHFPSQKPSYL
jgi:hypothetical protein